MKNKKLNFRKKEYLIITLVCVMLSLLFVPNVIAPPTPHSINGYIFYPGGTQVPLGTKYSLNDSTSGYYKQSQTSFPIPGRSGFYSETISGTDGDLIIIFAWNATSYGQTNITLAGTMKDINVTLNLSRSPEPTVNITSPADNILRNDSVYFTLISNLTLYGNNANNCVAAISYSNTSVLSTYNNQNTTINLGNLNVGYSRIITWNLSVIGLGSSNVTINFTCDGMFGTRFETLDYTDTLLNITTQDKAPPNITLISPLNNTKTNELSKLFQYNVTDLSNITNCSLYINNTFKQENTTVIKNTIMTFLDTLSYGINIWQIRCYDFYNNLGYSKNYTITFENDTRAILTDNPTYIQGFKVLITGYNWTNNSIVTILLNRSDLSTKTWNTTATNNIINTNYWINYSDPTGVYALFAFEPNYTFYNATATFTVNQRNQGLFTDKQTYSFYENVTITGFNFTINGTVRLKIFQNESGATGPSFPKNITSNSSGNFSYIWNVTNTCAGIYGINAQDLNYTQYNVTIYFNITGGTPCVNWGNNAPNITSVIVDDIFSAPQNEINLLAAQQTNILCNVTAYDLDGYDDVINANATFYYYLNKSSDPDNKGTHYTNSSCTETGNNGFDTKYFTCGFNIWYYSRNGTWQCNASVYDVQNAKGYANDSITVLDLYALNITSLIDFGNVPTGSVSSEINAIITNLGNVNIGINISAYAVTPGDGIAMNCTQGNISLSDERYSNATGSFASKIPVTSAMFKPAGFNISRQFNGTLSQRTTYWMVTATPSSLGDCSGTVVVTAS